MVHFLLRKQCDSGCCGLRIVFFTGHRLMKIFRRRFPGYVAACLAAVLSVPASAQLVRQANTTLTLPANPPTTGYALVDAFAGITFSAPIAVASPPGETNRLFVVERAGRIKVITNLAAPSAPATFLDISSKVATDGENGLLGLAFHPQYAANGFFYVTYSTYVAGTLYQRVARFTVTANPSVADAASEVDLLSQLDEATNHNGGDIHFGPDGYLYYSIGDEGGGNDSFNNSQRIDKDFFSGILRIDVDRKPGSLEPNAHPSVIINSGTGHANYAIPPDNPFAGATTFNGFAVTPSLVRTEFWAVGLRNPFRFSFDSATGQLYVGDVGQDQREEVDIIVKGGNYGWNYIEGNIPGPRTPPGSIVWNPIAPIWVYDHSVGNVITGGVVSRGSRLSQLYGTYIFCDEGSGRVWSLKKNDVTGVYAVTQLTSESPLVAFGIDPSNGDVLACNISSGHIRRLVINTVTGSFPATLSATGAFASLATLTPNAGIVAYAPNVPFWSDYAIKSRWFSIPGLAPTFTFSPAGNWTLPTGTVWVKNFDIESTRGSPATARHLETRFIIKTTDGVYGISYKWRADQTDADLVPEGGDSSTFNVVVGGVTQSQTWTFPARASCLNCHTAVGGYALSFNTPQLNRTATYGGVPQNQIAALSAAGYFSAPVAGTNWMMKYAAAGDTTQSLEWRARSYLSVNCAQCHQPGGPALGNWDARITTKTENAGIVRGALNDNLGDAANRVIVPNDLPHSNLYQRINAVPGAGTIHMPPIASSERDLTGIQLISDWIQQSLPAYQTFAEWQLAKFGSTSLPAAQPAANPDGDFNDNRTEFLVGTNPNSASEAWTYFATTSGGSVTLSFPRVANRRFQVQVSSDLQTWSLWDVPANAFGYSATSFMDTMTGPASGAPQFFRFEIDLP